MTNSKKRLVLIATHKPCVLPTESLYLPVHCGRAVSQLNTSALHWMESHTIGDNTGDNISDLNPYFCELTALYWAWKNYEHIGSPEQIGLCHYRRFFMDFGGANEITIPVHYLNKNIRNQFNQHHNSDELTRAVDLLPYRDLKNDVEIYLNQNKGFFFNMFVLPKGLFFEYCDLIFPLLFKLFENSHWEKLDSYQKRMPGFIAERLTGGIIYHFHKKRKTPLHETYTIVPIFNSLSSTKHQIKITTYLAKHLPYFPNFYSLFLSAQSHFLKH